MSESADSAPKLPPHRQVHVDLGPKAYDVLIGRTMLSTLGAQLVEKRLAAIFDSSGAYTKVAIISDETVYPIFKQTLNWSLLAASSNEMPGIFQKFLIPSGESSKSIQQVAHLHSELAQRKFSRSSVIIALGGGVIGDLSGFVAATYLRGINFVQVPTTLLAMVDSSVGGKTGVNLPEGKNLVGAFHQPKLVIADLDTLATLPPREFAAGMAEVIKYGAIRDAALFARVLKGVKPDDADLDEIVERCVAIKARIVENDEFETKGERALLNFGHTIGHAIEKATGYTTYLHGEAISLGMRAAAWLSRREAGLSQEAARDIDGALIANQLPVVLKPEVDSKVILDALGNDKKVAADGGNRWVLLTEIGKAESGRIVSPALVEHAVEYLRTHPDDL
jgi:3-dehydroquinate synthase